MTWRAASSRGPWRRGALIATSGEQTSLFLAPPLIVSERELDLIFDAPHHGLELADKELSAATS